MGPICCPGTSVWNYCPVQHKIPKECRLQWHCFGSLPRCLVLLSTEHTAVFHTTSKLKTLLSNNMHGRQRLLLRCRMEKILPEEVRPHIRYTYSCYCILEQFPGLANSKLLGLAFCLLTLVSPPFQQTFLVSRTVGDAFEPTSQQCLLHAQSIRRGICSRLLREATGAILWALDAYLVTGR
jgi:hypothetical protein